MENMNINKDQRNKGRRDFLLLVGVFFLPIILVLVVYYNFDNWGLGAGRNHGDLVQPVRKLEGVELTDINGEPFRFADVRDKWLMVYFGQADCDQACKKDLYLMRQIRLAQGGDKRRIQRLYISTAGKPRQSLRENLDEHPDLKVLYAQQSALEEVLDLFRHDTGKGAAVKAIYLADPRGYLMMSYPEGYDPEGVIEDLERLLKYARSG